MNEQNIAVSMNNLDSALWWMDISMISSIFATVWIFASIIFIIAYALRSWGLYNINKKLWEPYPWLSWIPVIQMYSFVKAGGKSWLWILWIILWFIALFIPWLVLIAIVCNWIAKRTDRWFWSAIWIFFIPVIMLPVIGYKLKEKENWEQKTEEWKENIINKDNVSETKEY